MGLDDDTASFVDSAEMPSHDFAGRPVAELVQAFTSGAARARDILESVLARCERAKPFNPIATLDADGARARADALDARRGSGAGFGPLAAVPVSVKDLIPTAGLRTAFASLTMKDNVPAEDTDAVAQWRSADAVLFAKTTTPEYGHKVLTDSRLPSRAKPTPAIARPSPTRSRCAAWRSAPTTRWANGSARPP
jgi:aspartyl-tRNA(Asn)/glutamyl-tRNA(Gln) amidotransferase subunit A